MTIEVGISKGYVNWALTKKKLSPDTVKIYLSDLRLAHKIRSVNPIFENDFFIKAMLKGAKNVSLYTNITKKSKFVMSFPLLRIIGHEIALSNWSSDSKLVFWTACCVAFFGSFRLSEILPISENNIENLTWSQIKFTNMGSVVINIRFPKVIRNSTGDFVDLFEIKNSMFCPLSSLKALALQKSSEIEKNLPVFRFANGKNLNPKVFTSTVVSLLERHIGGAAKNFSGHSFRAAILSALANSPNLASDSDIMLWGRWSSESYKAYVRLKHNARKEIFNKIVSLYKLQ
jgi:hypothetical protein